MTTRVRRGLTAVLLAVPLTFATTSVAQATPSGCNWGTDGARGSYAVCTQGTGAYRSFTQCSTWTGFYYMRYGTWQVPSNPVWSKSSCDWGDTRHSYGINLS
jgi:hypothetical protein